MNAEAKDTVWTSVVETGENSVVFFTNNDDGTTIGGYLSEQDGVFEKRFSHKTTASYLRCAGHNGKNIVCVDEKSLKVHLLSPDTGEVVAAHSLPLQPKSILVTPNGYVIAYLFEKNLFSTSYCIKSYEADTDGLKEIASRVALDSTGIHLSIDSLIATTRSNKVAIYRLPSLDGIRWIDYLPNLRPATIPFCFTSPANPSKSGTGNTDPLNDIFTFKDGLIVSPFSLESTHFPPYSVRCPDIFPLSELNTSHLDRFHPEPILAKDNIASLKMRKIHSLGMLYHIGSAFYISEGEKLRRIWDYPTVDMGYIVSVAEAEDGAVYRLYSNGLWSRQKDGYKPYHRIFPELSRSILYARTQSNMFLGIYKSGVFRIDSKGNLNLQEFRDIQGRGLRASFSPSGEMCAVTDLRNIHVYKVKSLFSPDCEPYSVGEGDYYYESGPIFEYRDTEIVRLQMPYPKSSSGLMTNWMENKEGTCKLRTSMPSYANSLNLMDFSINMRKKEMLLAGDKKVDITTTINRIYSESFQYRCCVFRSEMLVLIVIAGDTSLSGLVYDTEKKTLSRYDCPKDVACFSVKGYNVSAYDEFGKLISMRDFPLN